MESVLWELYEQKCTSPKSEQSKDKDAKDQPLWKENLNSFGSTINNHHRFLNFAMMVIAVVVVHKSAGKKSANATHVMLATIVAILFPSLILVYSSGVYLFEKQHRPKYRSYSDNPYSATQSDVQSQSAVDSPLSAISGINYPRSEKQL
jgi:hypothetical protein